MWNNFRVKTVMVYVSVRHGLMRKAKDNVLLLLRSEMAMVCMMFDLQLRDRKNSIAFMSMTVV